MDGMTDFRKMTTKAGETDEWYTPEYAVRMLARYVKGVGTVWCPFDKHESMFVKVLSELGCDVICSHIENGGDFFKITPPECDMIISNPPYSLRDQVLERLYEIGKPFAMLLSSLGICEGRRHRMFSSHGVQFLIPNRRIRYSNPNTNKKSAPPFQSWYVCWRLLPNDIELVDVSEKG